jgi:galactonate dehydratase
MANTSKKESTLQILEAGLETTKAKITAIKAMQLNDGYTLIKVETDLGVCGYGEANSSGTFAREAIEMLAGPRLTHLGLMGKDPLALGVHFHNMFYAFPQRGRVLRVWSGIDIALWDLVGKLLRQAVSSLLGGRFRNEIKLYSHCSGGDYLDKAAWKERAAKHKADPRGFKVFKIDIHHALGIPMQEYTPSLDTEDVRRIHKAYALARAAFGDEIDIIVHGHNELDVPSAIRVAEAVEGIKPLYYEDPLAPEFSEAWLVLRRSTRLAIMTGENIELAEQALPFLQHQAVDILQPDLINSGGITGTKRIAELAALYRIPICLHNVSGLVLNLASQQFSAALFNCPMMECSTRADQYSWAQPNPLDIRDGYMKVSDKPGLGLELDQAYLKANRLESEPWWGDLG